LVNIITIGLAQKITHYQATFTATWINFFTTERFTDLGKQNFPMVVDFRLEPIFNTAPAASKNTA